MPELDHLARLLSFQDAAFSEFQTLLCTLRQHPLSEALLAEQAELLQTAQTVQASSERIHELYSKLTPYVERNLSTLQEQQEVLRRMLARLNQRMDAEMYTPGRHDWN